MIKAVVYDAVGTLIHVKPAVAAIYADVGRRFGSTLASQVIRGRFHTAFARQDRLDEQAGWRTSEAREIERWRDIVAEVLDDVADADACFAALFDAFGQADAWKCAADASQFMEAMQRLQIRQAMASNFDRRLHGVVATMPIARFLDPIVVSSEVGWRKPAPEFFAHVIHVLQLPAHEILFVGDDRVNDYEPARAVGMRAVLLDPTRQHLDLGDDRVEALSAVGHVCNVPSLR